MDRTSIVKITNDAITGSIDGQDIYNVLHDFCIEKNLTQEPLIAQCIQTIIQQGAWQQYLEIALKYFRKKFQVIEIYSQEKDKGIDMFGRPIKGRDLLRVL